MKMTQLRNLTTSYLKRLTSHIFVKSSGNSSHLSSDLILHKPSTTDGPTISEIPVTTPIQ